YPNISGTVTNIPADSPFNPFQQNINISFPMPHLPDFVTAASARSEVVRATAGIIVRLPGSWMAEVDYSWNRSRWGSIRSFSALDAAALTALRSGEAPGDG